MKIAKSVLSVSMYGLLTSILVIVMQNTSLFNSAPLIGATKNGLDEKSLIAYSTHAVSVESSSSQIRELEKMGIKVLPGAQAQETSKNDPRSLNKCVKTIVDTLKVLPKEHTGGIKRLTLSFDPTARRGLAGGDQMIIRCVNVGEAELTAVVVHEVGHIVDTGVNLSSKNQQLKSSFVDGPNPVYLDDPSSNFYSKSFVTNDVRKSSVDKLDFVSGYAMSDPFEDFAETYLFYVLHGDAFRQLAKSNPVLAEKYEFMKDKVFNSKEFKFENEKVDELDRIYDGTKMKFSLEKIFTI